APTKANSADEGSRYGWGVRPYSWEFAINGQREISRGLSLTAGYARRWFGNFLVTDDLNHTINDYESFSVSGIPAPPASAGGAALPGNIYTDQFYVLKPTAAAAAAP